MDDYGADDSMERLTSPNNSQYGTDDLMQEMTMQKRYNLMEEIES